MKLSLLLALTIALPLAGRSQCSTVANFVGNPTNGCSTPLTVFFTDMSTLADTWTWNFGDGSNSIAQNPIHTYTSTGSFTVTLTASNSGSGCSDQTTSVITISSISADFSGSTVFGCGPLTVNFTDNSTTSVGSTISSWSWSFGDGGSSAEQNPSYTYTNPGVYTVTLTTTNSNGCSKTRTKSDYIQVIGPAVNFNANTVEGCVSLLIDFTDNTTSGSTINSWYWDFGDGSHSISQNPSYNYTSSGDFDVSLTVGDLDGCSRTYTKVKYITINSVSDITTTLSGNTITANNNSATYKWLDCDDNNSVIPGETGQSFTAIKNGNYAAQITEAGCVDTSLCTSIIFTEIRKNNWGNALQLYPNPTDGNFSIDLGETSSATDITITTLNGEVIQSNRYDNSSVLNLKLDAPSGVYLLIVESLESKSVIRLLKK